MADVSSTETGSFGTDGAPRWGTLQMWATERLTGPMDKWPTLGYHIETVVSGRVCCTVSRV